MRGHSLQKQYEEEDRALLPVPVTNGKSKLCEAQQAKKEQAKRTMWVDKYRPTKFTDLLGEEVSLHLTLASVLELMVACRWCSVRIERCWDG